MKCFVLLYLLIMGSGYALANDYDEARTTLQQTLNELLEVLKDKLATVKDEKREDQFYYGLARNLLKVVDMKLMSKLALGKYWNSTDEMQKQRFIRGFEKMLIKSYAKQVALLADIEIEFLPQPQGTPPRKYQIIHTRVITADGKAPLQVNYSMINRDGWKVFDFIIGGVSILSQFRQNFDAEIRETGLQALIRRFDSVDV